MEPAAAVVLVVDDDRVTSALLQALLEEAGYVVEHAADGASGLARIAAGGIDLVLLDLVLPEVDGLELCQQVRAREGDTYVPILMLTALASDAQRRAGFAAGADDFVSKPFEVEDLLARVQVWARARERLQAARARWQSDQQGRQAVSEQEWAERLAETSKIGRRLAHRLNNDLTLAVGAVELLQHRAELPPELRSLVVDATGRLNAAIEHIAEFQEAMRAATHVSRPESPSSPDGADGAGTQ